MARITIEDCLEKVEDRFELVGLAAQRARDIASGSPLTIERNGEKDTVIALREIAEETIKVDDLREEYITSFESEKRLLNDFIAPANDIAGGVDSESTDSISIDEEEADIRAAIAEASEVSEAPDTESLEGYNVDITDEISSEEGSEEE